MTPHSIKVESLLRELVSSFIDYPHALEIGCFETPAKVDWVIQPDARDRAKVFGKDNAHRSALNFLVVNLGRVLGKEYTLRLVAGSAPEHKQPTPFAGDFDPAPACTLLRHWIAAFQIPALVEVKPHPSTVLVIPGFTFTITATDIAYYQALTLPISADGPEDETLIIALGILWRAIGKFNGVRFDVRAARL